MKKKVNDFVMANMSIGVGSMALGKMGADTSGMKAMSGMMPTMGNVMGAGMVMDQMKGLRKKK